uniref:Uncharacterized protein n=1 Tax=Kalanchoe fedtschenkoi TaxID=63787 RepID=A0A7N0SWE6_KALFE
MARSVRSSLKLLLKPVNAVFGISGLCLVAFGFWLWRVWEREVADGSAPSYSVPWFVYASIGVGAGLCLMACIGHLAADTASGFCLSLYLAIIFALTMFEIAFFRSRCVLELRLGRGFTRRPDWDAGRHSGLRRVTLEGLPVAGPVDSVCTGVICAADNYAEEHRTSVYERR